MTPRMDSNAARHNRGWIVLGGLFILACIIFQWPTSPHNTQFPNKKIQLGIDINSAGAAELACIPGVGEGLAQRIIDYRNAHGPFHSLGELENVPGVGPAKAAQLAEALLPLAETSTTRIASSPRSNVGLSTGNLHD